MALSLYSGDDDTLTADVTLNGLPLDLSGMDAATFMVKNSVNDADAMALITKTLGDGISVTSASAGILSIAIDAADTVMINKKDLSCALKIQDGLGGVHTVYAGPIGIIYSAVHKIR